MLPQLVLVGLSLVLVVSLVVMLFSPKLKQNVKRKIKKSRILQVFIFLIVFIILFAGIVMSVRLPVVNQDSGQWGTILNNYLLKQHDDNGSHKNVTIEGNFTVVNASRNKVFMIDPTSQQVVRINGTREYSSLVLEDFVEPYFILRDRNASPNEKNIGITGAKGNFTFVTMNDNFGWIKTILTIKNNGYMGVGLSVTNPQYQLQVRNSSQSINLSGLFFVKDGKVGIGTSTIGSNTALLLVTGTDQSGEPTVRFDEDGEDKNNHYVSFVAGGNNSRATMKVWRDLNSTLTGQPVVYIEQSNANDDQAAFHLEQEGIGNAIEVTDGVDPIFYVNETGPVGIGTTTPKYLLQVADTTGSGLSLNISDVLFVNGSSNNVGVGTVNPLSKLYIDQTQNTTALIVNTSGSKFGIYVHKRFDSIGQGNATDLDGIRVNMEAGSSGQAIIAVGNTSNIMMSASNSERGTNIVRMARGSSGGHITLFVYRHIDSTSTTQPVAHIVQDHASDDQTVLKLDQDGTGDILELIDDTTEVFTVDGFGNTIIGARNLTVDSDLFFIDSSINKIGISTTAPRHDLHINGTTGASGGPANILFEDGTNAQSWTIGHYDSSPPGYVIYDTTNSLTVLFAENRTGNIGIGTISPSQKLDVAGNVNISSGNLTINTQITPGAATDACARGTMTSDDNYIYVCNSTGQWVRASLSSW